MIIEKGKTSNGYATSYMLYSIPTLLVGKGGGNVNFYELLMYLITLIVLIIITKK